MAAIDTIGIWELWRFFFRMSVFSLKADVNHRAVKGPLIARRGHWTKVFDVDYWQLFCVSGVSPSLDRVPERNKDLTAISRLRIKF